MTEMRSVFKDTVLSCPCIQRPWRGPDSLVRGNQEAFCRRVVNPTRPYVTLPPEEFASPCASPTASRCYPIIVKVIASIRPDRYVGRRARQAIGELVHLPSWATFHIHA